MPVPRVRLTGVDARAWHSPVPTQGYHGGMELKTIRRSNATGHPRHHPYAMVDVVSHGVDSLGLLVARRLKYREGTSVQCGSWADAL